MPDYANRAADKLRAGGLFASHFQVFMHTSPFRGDAPYSNVASAELQPPRSDTIELVVRATEGARRIWRYVYRYSSAGVILSGLVQETKLQQSFLAARDSVRSAKLMAGMDAINQRHGRGTLQVASVGIDRGWGMRQDRRSPNYTTRLEDIPVVKA